MPEHLDFTKFIDWAFMGIVGAGVAWVAKSVGSLRELTAVALERMKWHERELKDHKDRISFLEKKRG